MGVGQRQRVIVAIRQKKPKRGENASKRGRLARRLLVVVDSIELVVGREVVINSRRQEVTRQPRGRVLREV